MHASEQLLPDLPSECHARLFRHELRRGPGQAGWAQQTQGPAGAGCSRRAGSRPPARQPGSPGCPPEAPHSCQVGCPARHNAAQGSAGAARKDRGTPPPCIVLMAVPGPAGAPGAGCPHASQAPQAHGPGIPSHSCSAWHAAADPAQSSGSTRRQGSAGAGASSRRGVRQAQREQTTRAPARLPGAPVMLQRMLGQIRRLARADLSQQKGHKPAGRTGRRLPARLPGPPGARARCPQSSSAAPWPAAGRPRQGRPPA